MPNLLSGSLLRRGGSGEFIDLAGAMPQLPPSPTTSTGYTLVTDGLFRTSYRSSLGEIQFNQATMYSTMDAGNITILNTGTNTISTGTTSGLLIVNGDIGVGGTMNIEKDIVINGVTFGRGYKGVNNIVVRGEAETQVDSFENGQESIAIGFSTLLGLETSYKNIAIGRYALSSGTNISNNIALGDSALKLVGITSATNDNNIGIGADAGVSLTSGEWNIFLGHGAADTLVQGNNNIIIGQYTPNILSITSGSNIVSIGGDNLIDGLDNQVNIGSVFYYDGQGYGYISSEMEIGLGSPAVVVSTSTMTGGLVVVGGIGVYDNAIIAGTGTSTSTTTGALVVTGGVGIGGDVYANTGIPEYNNLLYTPRVHTTSTAPTSARIGDIWIDDTIPAYLQYIKDGTSTFWIQVGTV
jgi:hypothetical protein